MDKSVQRGQVEDNPVFVRVLLREAEQARCKFYVFGGNDDSCRRHLFYETSDGRVIWHGYLWKVERF